MSPVRPNGPRAPRRRCDVLLAPAMNLQRFPLSGRNHELFSEDPFLTARMVVSYIRAAQAAGPLPGIFDPGVVAKLATN